MAKQLAFYFNASACNGCKVCTVACKSKNQLPVGINWRKVHQYGGGSWVQDANYPGFLVPTNMFAYSMSVSCMHCADPACRDVCPAGAIVKNADGVVTIDQNQCIGCRYCEWACPYGAPQFDSAKGVMTKCDFCVDLLSKGERPYCVDACVMRALDFGEIDELRAKYGDADAIEPLPSADFTGPALVVTPHPHAQKSGEGTGKLLDMVEV